MKKSTVYTDADVLAARIAHTISSADPAEAMRRALDVAGPSIAARAYAAGYSRGVMADGWVPTDEEAATVAREWMERGCND